MRPSPFPLPVVHFFVCENRRPEGSPLGSGCGDAGVAVYDALKAEVANASAYRAAWVTRTHCLGVCPKRGCAVAVYEPDRGGRVLTEVEAADAAPLFASFTAPTPQGTTGE
jgi:predicted metal-binding protein